MFIRKINPHGGDVYSREVLLDLSANLNPFGIPKAVREVIKESAESCSVYPDPYCRKLVDSISSYEGVLAEWILCGNGASELIYSYALSLPSDSCVLIVSPSFCEYDTAMAAAGVKVEYFIVSEREGFELSDNIFDLDLSRYSAIILCTPNNPTGVCIDPELLKKLADTGIRILCDMCFMELTERPERYDIPGLLQKYTNLTVLKALTKNYALAGLRLGYAMSSNEDMLERMSSKVQCWNVSYIAQQAGTAALECRDWLNDTVAKISSERRRLTEELESMGIRVFPSEANFLLLYSKEDLPSILMEKGILIRDCSNYLGLRKGFFRIAVKTAPENDLFLQTLREVLK